MKKQFISWLAIITSFIFIPFNFSQAITQNQINSEVQIVCTDGLDNWFSGSGTIIDPKGIILTNRHVVEGAYKNTCMIGFLKSINQEPDFGSINNLNLAEVKYVTTDKSMDTAVLYLNNPNNQIFPYVNIWNSNSNNLKFGDKIEVVGYPGVGGSTITYTSGDFSGFGSLSDGTQNYIKTTAMLEHGNSGGSAYNQAGEFIGIPSMVVTGSLNSMSYVLSVNSIKKWLSSFLGNDYKQEIIEQKPIIPQQPEISLQSDIIPPDISKVDLQFYDCSKWFFNNPNKYFRDILGQIQVTKDDISEDDCVKTPYNKDNMNNINPEYIFVKIIIPKEIKADVKDWDFQWSNEINNYQLLKSRGFGDLMFNEIGNGFLWLSPAIKERGIYYFSLQLYDQNNNASEPKIWEYDNESSKNAIDSIFAKKQSGKILLQVESHGEAWYVNPKDEKRYYMANGDKAYDLMRNFGVGITNKDLDKIKANKTLAKKYSGKIFLQVEAKGEAYYIDFNGVAHYLKNGAAAYEVMRSFGLGITNTDLDKISEGNL
jgi:V8-like Glu-specific endopeptidase